MTPNTAALNESLFMAMELSKKNWKLAFSNGEKVRQVNVPGGDQKGLSLAIDRAREKLGLARDCAVYSCYEAGRDGFWIHRCLDGLSVQNLVVDPASIEINRRRRHLKTDRIDAEKLVRMLMRYWLHNEKTLWRVAVVPSSADEDQRRIHRENERIKIERAGHFNRIRSLLVQHGIKVKSIQKLNVGLLKDWQGQSLARALLEEIERELVRMTVADNQIKVIESEQRKRLKKPVTGSDRTAAKLKKLKGIGQNGSWLLSKEFFGWRKFHNRREVGSLAGLTGTAYSSGNKTVEQGISKAGNKRVRTTMIELAWNWTWYQPDSELTKWFMRRFGNGSKRMRRIGIVALARKLLVALWKYVESDEVPSGAVLAA